MKQLKLKQLADEVRQEMIDADIQPFEPPNFLEWDRQEREEEYARSELMLKISQEVRADATIQVQKAQGESEGFDKKIFFYALV